MKKGIYKELIYILLALAFVAFLITLFNRQNNSVPYVYSDIYEQLQNENVKSLKVSENSVRLELYKAVNNKTQMVLPLNSFSLFYDNFHEIVEKQYDSGVIKYFDYPSEKPIAWTTILMVFISVLVLIALIWYLITLRQMRSSGGAGAGGRPPQFGRANTRTLVDMGRKITFADVAGADEEKEELEEIVEFLGDPERFMTLGARIPKGVLLVGPPGTGKTLLAKAVAGEAGVNFLSISGSDFVELYVGVGAARVRDLFGEAKKTAPAIIFIDEIDAVGRQRGTGLGGGHDEREQTLNQLLVEMDGFANNEGVIVMAATNRADVLDPALLRPGRFDRQVYVGLPDIRGREEILKIYARNKPLSDDVNILDLARTTSGFTGADLENLMNEASLLAARHKKPVISKDQLDEALLKVIAGPEKKSRVIPEHAKRLTAYHEAGHAVVIRDLPTQDPVHHITIIPRGMAGGVTIFLPQEDKPYRSKIELEERICCLLGGRVAEELVLGDSSTGASNDLQRATETARAMVTKYGMSPLIGTVAFGDETQVFIGRSMGQSRSYSEEVAGLIDEEIKRIVSEQYVRCREILERHRDKLELVAQYLLHHETMSAEEFDLAYTDPQALEERLKTLSLPAEKTENQAPSSQQEGETE